MESLMNFIFDYLWLIIIGSVFLSGFRKSKKKKGPPVEEQPSTKGTQEEYDIPIEEMEKEPSPIDDLPLPESIKKIMREVELEEDKPFRSKEKKEAKTPLPRKAQPENMDVPTGHFDNPWSGEGKENAHEEVRPTNSIEPAYGGNGKVFAKRVVTPQDHPSYVKDPLPSRKETVEMVKEVLAENQDAYSEKQIQPLNVWNKMKLAEAIVMSEVLGKPKAIRSKQR